jgi:hypothetical protein
VAAVNAETDFEQNLRELIYWSVTGKVPPWARDFALFNPDETEPFGDEVFTKEMREVPVKRGKLTRVPFHVSRLMEFCTEKELVNQTGHSAWYWPEVVLKELIDNGLDACEEAEVAPVISVEVKGDTIIIADNGPGIPASVIKGVLNYSIRVSQPRGLCLADARRPGQCAQNHPANGLCAR